VALSNWIEKPQLEFVEGHHAVCWVLSWA